MAPFFKSSDYRLLPSFVELVVHSLCISFIILLQRNESKYSFLFDVNSSASGKYVSVSRSILWSSKALRYMASPSAKIWSTILEVDCKTAHEFAARLRFVMSGEDWHSNKVYVMAKFLPQATGNFDSCTVTHARIIIGRVPLTRVPACSSGHPPFILRSSIAKIEIETGCIVVPRPPRQD